MYCTKVSLCCVPDRSQLLTVQLAVPYRFSGLYTIGLLFFFFNIILFIVNVTMISLRFYKHPEMFMASILHPTERLFLPAAVVSFGTILLNISQYGPSHAGHWLDDAVTILFWIDAALALCASMGVYLVMQVLSRSQIKGALLTAHKVVHSIFYYLPDDPNLDFSNLPFAHCRPSCWCSRPNVAATKSL